MLLQSYYTNRTYIYIEIFYLLSSIHPPLSRLNRFLQYLTEAGFRVSRTHFDPTGVRTDATLDQFKSVLTKYSVPTYTNTTATQNPEETVRAME